MEDHDVSRRAAPRPITAPCVFDGAINGERFRAWVEQALAPTQGCGDVVIMDNLPAHKVQGVRDAIEAKGACLLYLPPHSPDLNPIEQAFAKLKALLRSAAKRTVDALWNAIGHALDAFSLTECSNYFANAGYVPSHRETLYDPSSTVCPLESSYHLYVNTLIGFGA